VEGRGDDMLDCMETKTFRSVDEVSEEDEETDLTAAVVEPRSLTQS